jgi:hypothetical protein
LKVKRTQRDNENEKKAQKNVRKTAKEQIYRGLKRGEARMKVLENRERENKSKKTKLEIRIGRKKIR